MRVRTSVTLPKELLVEVDALAGKNQRSAIFESALVAYVAREKPKELNQHDIDIINANAEKLNEEALDVLEYQKGELVKRGDLYRVSKPNARDPKRFRVFVVVSRQILINSDFSTVTCAPIYSNCEGLETQVPVGADEGLKHDSCIFCDELVSFPKSMLTQYVGSLSKSRIEDLNNALMLALELGDL